VKDPVRAGLYTMKQEWTAVREYVIRENLLGRLSEDELVMFQAKDKEFAGLYDVALNFYLSGTSGPGFDSALRTLRNMIIDARHKYMEGG
jgi:hypothetical protein